jgi:hypothetical protein
MARNLVLLAAFIAALPRLVVIEDTPLWYE